MTTFDVALDGPKDWEIESPATTVFDFDYKNGRDADKTESKTESKSGDGSSSKEKAGEKTSEKSGEKKGEPTATKDKD